MLILSILFLIVAIFYASVGFGGGSSYLAILSLSGVSYAIFPIIALCCNMVVTTQGTIQYARKGFLKASIFMPWCITSIPLAYAGGRLHVSEATFQWLLPISLTAAGIALLSPAQRGDRMRQLNPAVLWIGGGIIGGLLGLLAGLVGIGGGIFLSPVMNLTRWADAKEIAATASIFIFLNSIAGITGQLQKNLVSMSELQSFMLLPIVVLLGGLLGNHLGTRIFSQLIVKRMTGILVLIVAGRLWFKLM